MTIAQADTFGRRVPEARAPTWRWLYATAAAALALRLAVALLSLRVSHPDEVFQYLEQAHRLVYGYGFLPWEYRFGVRNWLLPGALAGLLEMLRLFHLDTPSAYGPAINSVFALLSLCVVFSSYNVGRNLFNEGTGRFAAIFAAIWFELLYASPQVSPEVLGAYAIFGALALSTAAPSAQRAAMAGVLLGLGVVLRLQYAVAAGVLFIYVPVVWGPRFALPLIAGAIPVIAAAGLLDLWSWGTPFVSYVNTFVFGTDPQLARIWGVAPWFWYVISLSVVSLGLFPAAMAYGAVHWRRYWLLMLLIVSVLVPHSLIAHKEHRYVFLAIPLLGLLLADIAASWLGRRPLVPVAALSLISLLGSHDLLARDGHLAATLDLSRRSNVRAVVDLTGPWWKSGGYYYLHRDVPLYFPEQLTNVSAADLRRFASHIIVRASEANVPGFRVSSLYHDVAILEQLAPPRSYRRVDGNNREPAQPGIDGRFTPRVRPRF